MVLLNIGLYSRLGRLNSSRDQQLQSILLAEELKQSSEDLTRFARTFVITGDSGFYRQYWSVINTRNGANGKSLQTRMIEAGFTADEFAKLASAQKNSDELAALEIRAMDARNLTSLTDSAYHAKKAVIMRPLDEFFEMFSARTSA